MLNAFNQITVAMIMIGIGAAAIAPMSAAAKQPPPPPGYDLILQPNASR